MRIREQIRTIIRNRYVEFPILWRKDTEIPFGSIGIREWIGLHSIALWYLVNQRISFTKYSGVVKSIREDLKTQYSVNDKKLLFIVERDITGRLEKMSKALCEKGYAITLLYSSTMVTNEDALKRLTEYCDIFHTYDSTPQLLYYVIESKIPLAHFFVAGLNCISLLLMLQIKGIMPKLVVERYDIISGMYKPHLAKKKYCRAEKYFMEHSDGVCSRDYAIEYCVEKLQFHLRRKYLIFLDYAERVDLFQQKAREELSLCYVGSIRTEKEDPNAPLSCFLELAAMCEAGKCHFHVYPSEWNETKFSQQIEYSQKSSYFHFHHPVEYNKLYEEISQYDYGVQPIRKNFREQDLNSYSTKNKTVYATGNKYFDYISAGIPMIGAFSIRQTEELEKHGGILRWTIEDYDFDELRRRKAELKEELIQSREYWMIDNRISELINYYEEILLGD